MTKDRTKICRGLTLVQIFCEGMYINAAPANKPRVRFARACVFWRFCRPCLVCLPKRKRAGYSSGTPAPPCASLIILSPDSIILILATLPPLPIVETSTKLEPSTSTSPLKFPLSNLSGFRYQIVIVSTLTDRLASSIFPPIGNTAERTEKGQQMKINLGNKQIETLEEMMNVAINLLEGVEEYKADQKRYEALRASVETQLAKRGN